MRKLVAALTFLAVPVLPAAALAQPRWHRGAKAQVTVYVEKIWVGATNWSYIKRAGVEWARGSRIRVVFVKRRPSPYYCMKVYVRPSRPHRPRQPAPDLRPSVTGRAGLAPGDGLGRVSQVGAGDRGSLGG